MPQKIYTIGVYGFRESEFFQKIIDNDINLFIDVRARRGMRGNKYRFANSAYLQLRLKELGIKYFHYKELAPTQEIRDMQKKEDIGNNLIKSKRKELADSYIQAYKQKILFNFDLNVFQHIIDPEFNKILLFCVEKYPEACHRSLAATYLAEKLGLEVEHL